MRIINFLIISLFVLIQNADAQYVLTNNVLSNGYSSQSSSNYQFTGTVGFPMTGNTAGDEYSNQVGWWYMHQNLSIPVIELEPPSNIQVRDVSNDQGHGLKVSWDVSLSEESGTVTWYRIYRSCISSLTEPIPLTQFTSPDSLNIYELSFTILVDSVSAGVSEYIDTVPVNGVNYYYWIQSVAEDAVSEKAVSGIITLVESVPCEFRLNTPYPNPFNPETTIEYYLPKETHVTLTIFNVSGQSISVLKDELQQSGNHIVSWKAKGLPSGLYFCTLKTNNYTDTKKMVLLR